ncbi:MAG: hypothetical protein CO042_01330 [Parcubacteria group bacterium CG_4_9_14_0_2_um_filter_41_8]|nr:MAG: hypothetical protein COW93_02075 [Parcubacteria group bacterium CG22_combo_CG10-13_8_21_14_all_41_9]PJC40891.1 MAG: hypothetical protein CO042_01330 [Parcubacteria group bacterium CG_4_9_14_0_2_um_filter_41_8]
MHYDFFKKQNMKIAGATVGVLIIFIILFGIGIYKLGWQSKSARFVSRVVPYPAILVDWELIGFYTYVDELRALEQYWDFQRENKNVLLGIPEKEEIRERLVNKLITEKITAQFARANGILIDDQDLYLEWDRLRQSSSAQSEISDFLSSAYGWSDKKFISKVLYPFLLEEKVKSYLIQQTGDSDDQILEDAREIYVLTKEQGADFSSLAKEYSEDDFSGKNGGDLGYFGRGTMDPYFEEAVFSMNIGDISEPVKSSYGYHIIKLEDLLYNDDGVPTQARVRHILIKGFDFDEWMSGERDRVSVFRLVR